MSTESSKHSVWFVNSLLALTVWAIWYFGLGRDKVIATMLSNWEVSLTMFFGSIIAGGTSEGGGAIAFPVFTKIFQIPAEQARVFSLAIQSVGMTAASLTIIYLRLPVDWKVIRIVSLSGAFGIVISGLWFSAHVSTITIRLAFTLFFTSFAVILAWITFTQEFYRNKGIKSLNMHDTIILSVIGFIGGMISAIIGTGIDILTFSILVILFQVNEKTATPTSVIIMAITSLCGFGVYAAQGAFSPLVTDYWLASVPIVVVGAPLGAVLCSYMTRKTIAIILIVLILIEFFTTIVLVPVSPSMALWGFLCCIIIFLSYYTLFKIGNRRLHRIKKTKTPT